MQWERKQNQEHQQRQQQHCSLMSVSPSLRELVGDYGVALFDPLSEEEFYPTPQQLSSSTSTSVVVVVDVHHDAPPAIQDMGEDESEESSEDDCDNEDQIDYLYQDEESIPVQIEPEPEACLKFAPRLLSKAQFQELVDDGIPQSLRIYKWKRIFAIGRDGDAFVNMIEKCHSYKHTLIVVKTTKGHLLGGFASEPWRNQDGKERCSYFGTGLSFLFSDYPRNMKYPHKNLTTYKWTGENDYCQICDTDRRTVAMGGGDGDFGLIIEDSFLRGTSGNCATFGNPPLVPGIGGSFDVMGFEVYGMLPLMPTVTKFTGTKYCTYSLLKRDH